MPFSPKAWTNTAATLLDKDALIDLETRVTDYTDSEGASKADLASPVFTGDPKAPTPAAGDDDTSIATTAFVHGEIATASGLWIPKSLIDAKGDLIVGTADDTPAIVPVSGVDGHVLTEDSSAAAGVSWQAPSGGGGGGGVSIPVVTSLPGSPADGDLIDFEVDAAHGIYWLLRYNATTGKWSGRGGSPLADEVDTNPAQSTASGGYAALTTAGPSITLPFPGVFDITTKCLFRVSGGSNPARMSYDIGATGAADGDQVLSGSLAWDQAVRTERKTFAAAATLTAKYRVDGVNSADFNFRRIEALPVLI